MSHIPRIIFFFHRISVSEKSLGTPTIGDILDFQKIHTGLESYHKYWRESKGAMGDACSGMAAESQVFKIIYDRQFTKLCFAICTNRYRGWSNRNLVLQAVNKLCEDLEKGRISKIRLVYLSLHNCKVSFVLLLNFLLHYSSSDMY